MTLSPTPPAAESTPDSSAPDAAELALIRSAIEGEAGAFDQIVHTHSRRVFHFVRQMTRQHQDAEDITQQTFIKAYRHLGRFDPRRPLINWLLTIARHTALNHFRGAKKWEEMPADAADHTPSPARQAEQKEQHENLWDRARALLAPRDFQVLWLRFAENMSVEETAQVAGLTQTHVKVLVHRARQALLKGKESP